MTANQVTQSSLQTEAEFKDKLILQSQAQLQLTQIWQHQL